MSSESPSQAELLLSDVPSNNDEPFPIQLPAQATGEPCDHSVSIPALTGTFTPGNPNSQRFPEKLYRLLDRAEAEGFNHVISWQPHGRCFVVHDREAFKGMLSDLMPGMTRWKSFQRQLRLWSFTRLTEGLDFNGYYHEMFLRYRPHLLCHMRRGFYGDRTRDREHVEVSPNFYAMPFLIPVAARSGIVSSTSVGATASLSAHPGSMSNEFFPLDPSVSIGHSVARASNQGNRVRQNTTGTTHGSQATAEHNCSPLTSWPTLDVEALEESCYLALILASQPTNVPQRGNQPSSLDDRVAGLTDELEPRPLPPVIARDGDTVFYSHTPIPVMQHPGFAQIGLQVFYRAPGGVDQNQVEPARQSHDLERP
jgi:HSF-type DNA-binding